MSDLEGKGDPSTSAVSKSIIPPDKSSLENSTDDAVNITKTLKLGGGDTIKEEKDGNLISTNSATVEKGDAVDTNLKSAEETFAEGDQILDKTAATATELTKTKSLEVSSTLEAAIGDPQTISSKELINSNDINPSDDQNDSFDEDLELRWEDDEKDDEYSTNLSDEALKLLDKELGIEDKGSEIKTNTEIADDITKQSITEEKDHKVTVEDTKSEINIDVPVKTEVMAETVTGNINTEGKSAKIDNNTKSLLEINRSTDKLTDMVDKDIKHTISNESTISKSELVDLHVNSAALNEENTASSSITAADVVKKDEIDNENAKNNELKEINQLELITDIATDSEVTPNIEEMDVDEKTVCKNVEKIDNSAEITKQSIILEQDNQIKIDAEIIDVPSKEIDTQEKTLLKDFSDIEMTDITDQSSQKIDSSEQIKVNPHKTKNEKDPSKQEIPIDEECKVVTDENVKNTETKVTTIKANEVLCVTKGMKTDLGLNKPDVMIEIPTQELIDIDDFDDSLEMDSEIIDSEVNNSFNNKNDTSTHETKALLEENTIIDSKNTKLTIEQHETTMQSKDKDVTVTELVEIAIEKEQSVETLEKLDKNNMIINADTLIVSDKGDNPIPSDDSDIKSIPALNNDEITVEKSSNVSDDNLTVEQTVKIDVDSPIKEPTSKTTDLNTTAEPISKSNDDNTTVPTIEVTSEKMIVEPISKPNNDCMSEEQTSEVHESLIKKETSNLDHNIIAEVSNKNLNITKSTSKDDDIMTKETSNLDKHMTAKPITKPNDGKTEDDDKTTKESPTNENKTAEISKKTENMIEEASKENPECDENVTAEPISKAKDDNITKEPSVDQQTTKQDNQNTTETTSKPDDDMTDGPEISDSLGLLAESSRVMDDDDQDEDDDSDDFDQDDESSNLQTAEHSEESNPPSDEAQPDDKEAMPEDSVVEGEEIVENEEDTNTGMEIVDDIVCEETDIVEKVGAIIESDIKSTTPDKEISKEETQSKEEETADTSKKEDRTVLRELLLKDKKQGDETQQSPSKSLKLSISKTNEVNVMTYVDLDESSEDELKEIKKEKSKETKQEKETEVDTVEEIKPKLAFKMTKLNTSEVTIKTGVSSKPPLIIPEITNVSEIDKVKENTTVENQQCLQEIFNIDSGTDDEDIKKPDEKIIQGKFNPKCINPMCISPSTDQHYVADAAAMRHYGATKRRAVCAPCLANVETRNEALIKGIKDLTPLLELNMEKPTNQLVEISDSESDDDTDLLKECNEFIGLDGAKMLNEKLADLINDAWEKFNMDDRLKDSENYINGELQKLEDEGSEINKMLNECQVQTDRIRNELYQTFERSCKSLPSVVIHDTPGVSLTCLEKDEVMKEEYASPYLRSALEEPPAKRQNRGGTPNNAEVPPNTEVTKSGDDDRDVSVVLLSAESAPDDLPPPGEVTRPPLRVGMQVHAMRNAFGSWLRGKILDIQPKLPGQQYTHCRIKFDHNIKNPCKVLPARCIAFQEPCSVRMTIGTRVLALFKDSNGKESFYSGVVAEIPNPVNSYRYLVFFDDGYAQYVKHKDTRLVCESKSMVWEEVHPFIRDFVKDYLLKYPERPMVRLHAGQRLNTEWNGKWWTSRVLQVDASLAHVHFEEDNRTEWIYRGSTRLAPLYLELQAAGRSRTRLPRSKAQFRTNMPYVEYMRSEEQSKQQQQLQQEEMIRRQRAVAKKSVSLPQPAPMVDKPDSVTSRVVYYTPKNAVKPYKMVPHPCGPQCRRTDVLSLKELRTYNPLAKPLLSGWERMQVRFKGSKHIMYRAPCGRRIRDMKELHRYLRGIQSDLPVDLFDFNVNTHCLAEFVLHKYNVMKKDLSHGKESVPVPCVNYYDDSLPEFCSYNTERTPTAGVPLNLDPDFLCGCDCEDDCEDKTKCACWKMTLEGARTIGLDSPNVGYVYRRLPEPLPSGIYECNSRCKCKNTCLNRVAQHPLQLKLQVFKTLKRGWGIRALNDVPKGSFLCVYAGNLLTDATANLDGLNEGDEYLAELDYIEVVEQMKEGFEEDIPEADKKLDKKESKQSSTEDEEETESEEDNRDSDKNDKDGDFQPGYIGLGLTEFNKRLRKRGRKKQTDEKEDGKEKETAQRKTDDCITISDDEEVREPSRFTAQAGMGDKGFISKYRSVRTLFGKDEACYIMDAKVQGNIGRYLNHSCCPNVFVQNVFVDTHDPRFPWVAFFALSHIRAGTELTWNYNYDIGSVPGKILYCYCGAHNCRGRLL